jgi:hypothetical protein
MCKHLHHQTPTPLETYILLRTILIKNMVKSISHVLLLASPRDNCPRVLSNRILLRGIKYQDPLIQDLYNSTDSLCVEFCLRSRGEGAVANPQGGILEGSYVRQFLGIEGPYSDWTQLRRESKGIPVTWIELAAIGTNVLKLYQSMQMVG